MELQLAFPSETPFTALEWADEWSARWFAQKETDNDSYMNYPYQTFKTLDQLWCLVGQES